jgi:hypothetical protein
MKPLIAAIISGIVIPVSLGFGKFGIILRDRSPPVVI